MAGKKKEDRLCDVEQKYQIKKKVIVQSDMFYSRAFRSLSLSAMITLMRCLQKRSFKMIKKRPHYYNEPFIFPYQEAKALGIGTTQHWKNIRELVELGFITLDYQGGRYQKNASEKDYSKYRLSELWRHYPARQQEKPKVLKPEHCIQQHKQMMKQNDHQDVGNFTKMKLSTSQR